jgi:hypothetical protein
MIWVRCLNLKRLLTAERKPSVWWKTLEIEQFLFGSEAGFLTTWTELCSEQGHRRVRYRHSRLSWAESSAGIGDWRNYAIWKT